MLGPFPFDTFACVGCCVLLCVRLMCCLWFGFLVWSHEFEMSDCLFVLWVGCVTVAFLTCWVHPPFGTVAWVGCCVLLCVWVVFCLCVGVLVWPHGFRMSDCLVALWV